MTALTHAAVRPIVLPSLGGIIATVDLWRSRRSQRRALLALDEVRLHDIGLSRADAWAEGHKPFWRA
ncbi:MAG: DUF1127 domain-containing protein [Geminicoccaceae bacterium]